MKVNTSIVQPENPHVLKVAVIGAANAGKSTLVNRLVGEQVRSKERCFFSVLLNMSISYLDLRCLTEGTYDPRANFGCLD